MTKTAWIAVLVLNAAAFPVHAIDENAGTGGAAFMKIGFGSTRAMAMGRAYVALADSSDALSWNPAGLALAQTREFSYSYMRYVQQVDAPLYLSYAHPMGQTVVGANMAYLSVDGFDVRDDAGRPLNNSDVVVRDGFIGFGAARSFWYEKLFAGAAVKAVHEDNAGARRTTMAGDLGLIFRPNNWLSWGAALQNLGTSATRVARMRRLGVAVRPLELLTLSMELSKASDTDDIVGLGAEFVLPEEFLSVMQVSLRTGYYGVGGQGKVLAKERHFLYPLVGAQGMTFGLGFFSSQAFGYGIGLDYALVPMGALGTADYISLKVKF